MHHWKEGIAFNKKMSSFRVNLDWDWRFTCRPQTWLATFSCPVGNNLLDTFQQLNRQCNRSHRWHMFHYFQYRDWRNKCLWCHFHSSANMVGRWCLSLRPGKPSSRELLQEQMVHKFPGDENMLPHCRVAQLGNNTKASKWLLNYPCQPLTSHMDRRLPWKRKRKP